MGNGEFLFLLKGLQWTLVLSAVGFACGMVSGLGVALARTSGDFDRWSASRPATSRCFRARRC